MLKKIFSAKHIRAYKYAREIIKERTLRKKKYRVHIHTCFLFESFIFVTCITDYRNVCTVLTLYTRLSTGHFLPPKTSDPHYIYDLCFNNFPHPPNNSTFPNHFETLWFVFFEFPFPPNLLVVPVNAFILTHLCLPILFRFLRSSSSFFFLVAVARSTAVFLSNSLQDRIRIISPFFSKSSNVMWVTDRVAVSNA